MPKRNKSGSSISKRTIPKRKPSRKSTSIVKSTNHSFNKVWTTDNNAESVIIRDFDWTLPKDYREDLIEIMDILKIKKVYKDIYSRGDLTISTEEKEQLLKYFDVENEPKERKEAIIFLPVNLLIRYKGNPYRPGNTEFYINKFKKWNKSDKKLELPWVDVSIQKNRIEVGEGNHRIKALHDLGFKYAPVKIVHW